MSKSLPQRGPVSRSSSATARRDLFTSQETNMGVDPIEYLRRFPPKKRGRKSVDENPPNKDELALEFPAPDDAETVAGVKFSGADREAETTRPPKFPAVNGKGGV